MNPETEVRLTAYLLGELPPEEVVALQAELSADPELRALEARLRRAVVLVQEANALPEAAPPAEPLRLSPERRERLLRHFATAPANGIAGEPTAIEGSPALASAEPAVPAHEQEAGASSRPRPWVWMMQFGLAAALTALLGGVAFLRTEHGPNERIAEPAAEPADLARSAEEKPRQMEQEVKLADADNFAFAPGAPPASSSPVVEAIVSTAAAKPAQVEQKLAQKGSPVQQTREYRFAGAGQTDAAALQNLPATMFGRAGGAPRGAAPGGKAAATSLGDDVKIVSSYGLDGTVAPPPAAAAKPAPYDRYENQLGFITKEKAGSLAADQGPDRASGTLLDAEGALVKRPASSNEQSWLFSGGAAGAIASPAAPNETLAKADNLQAGQALMFGAAGAVAPAQPAPGPAVAAGPKSEAEEFSKHLTISGNARTKDQVIVRTVPADVAGAKPAAGASSLAGGFGRGENAQQLGERSLATGLPAPAATPLPALRADVGRSEAVPSKPALSLMAPAPSEDEAKLKSQAAEDNEARAAIEAQRGQLLKGAVSRSKVAASAGKDGNGKIARGDAPASAANGVAPPATQDGASKLRSGDLATSQNAIDALLFDGATKGGDQPAAGALSGVFTDPQSQVTVRALNQSEGGPVPAATPAAAKKDLSGKVAEVKQLSDDARGFAASGRYDLAYKRSEQVLNLDPYNLAARQLQEDINKKRTEYGIEGYDQTRSQQLWQLEKKWDMPVRRFSTDRDALASPAAPAAAPTAATNADPSELFLNAYQAAQKGAKLEHEDRAGALAQYQEAMNTLGAIRVEHAEWNPKIVEYRARAVQKSLDRLSAAPPAPAAEPALVAETKPSPAPTALATPPPVPQPEVETAADAFSTFSLNVSDVSFQLAAASLGKSVLPEPGAVRSEEFINAFDYRDPEPAGGAALAFASDRARDPFAQNRDLLRFSIKTAAAGRAPGRPLNLVLLLDGSGSMERADRVTILREALRVLAGQLQAQDTLSVITFAQTPRLRADGVSGTQAAETFAALSELTPEGGTDLAAALDLGYETALRHYSPASSSRVVLLTDGAANLGEVDGDALQKRVEAHRLQGVALDCFGIGWEGYHDELLEQLTRHGDGRYGFLNTPEEAAQKFAGQLAGALRVAAADVKAQVEWNPARVTAWRQVGYARHQLTKEQFRDNTVDAAEIGAAESGNAVYVVQVKAEGEGDLGTVRVRYRVPGTQTFREQAWPVPYTGHPAALEEAAPALRLAAVASAFAEQLAASPFATEVTSDRLLALLQGVPAIYRSDPRPAQLEAMIRQAKSLSGH